MARHTRTRWSAAAIAAVVLLAASCGGGEETTTTTVEPARTTTTGTSVTTAATATTAGSTATVTTAVPPDETVPPGGGGGIDTMPGASTEPRVAGPTATGTALLTAVRAARHEGYDRVVFEFRNVMPGYDVRYVAPPVRADGSGEVVAVKGDHIVVVRMSPAAGADLSTESATPTYTGPDRFTPATPVVTEVVRTGDFEGVLTWAIGVNSRVDFRVLTLTGPPRLVIDLRNH